MPGREAGTPPLARTIRSVEELVPLIELAGIRVFEMAGKRRERGSGASDEAAPAGGPVEQMAMQVMENHGPDFIVTRFRATLAGREADYVADFGLRYTFSEALELTQPAIEGLLSRVAAMSVWPFIREAIATTAARMNLKVPVLGLVRQGELQVVRAEDEGTSGQDNAPGETDEGEAEELSEAGWDRARSTLA